MTKEDLYKVYEEMYGQPGERIQMGEYDLAYILPIEEEDLPDGEMMSIGLSAFLQQHGCNAVEFALYLLNVSSPEVYDETAKRISALVDRFMQEKKCFETGMVIRNISLPSFNSMNCLYLPTTHLNAPEKLGDAQVIELAPLYEQEANELASLPIVLRTLVFKEAGKEWSDGARQPLHMTMQALENIWSFISKWYSDNSPKLYADLKSGASAEMIGELESFLKMELPPDYKASLAIHNGDVYFHSHRYLPAEEVKRTWSIMKETNDTGAFGQGWWNTHWIPFAKDSGGNLMCIDVSQPDAQPIVYWDKEDGPLKANFSCFLDWLMNYRNALHEKRFTVNSEGYLEEKH